MNKLIYILLKRYQYLDINKLCFNCLFIIPVVMITKSLVCGWKDLSYLIGIGYLISFGTNRLLWNLRTKMMIMRTRICLEDIEEKLKQEQSRQKPNLYIVRKSPC
jgi:hypothetical protein